MVENWDLNVANLSKYKVSIFENMCLNVDWWIRAFDSIAQADFDGYDDSKVRKAGSDWIVIVDGFLDYLNNKENYCD
jgi:hypothetical protein